MGSAPEWRPILAAFANDDTRSAYARIVLGETVDGALSGLSPSRRRHVLGMLTGAGLVDADAQVDTTVFARVLAAHARPKVEGVDRFLRSDGRIDRYPSNHRERGALLRHVAERALRQGEVLDEKELGERLSAFTDDVAVLRRYLVDHDLLERTRSGSEYARVSTPPQEPIRDSGSATPDLG